jgi:diacylglycerol kinase family enzyme
MPTGAAAVQLLVLLAVLIIATAALALSVRTRRRPTPGQLAETTREPADGVPTSPLPAVVANPTKIRDVDGERAWFTQRCTEHGWRRPLWYETRIEEPGTAVTREAVARGAATVLAYGGDGTVRAVAGGLEGTSTSLGILPMGTGNLLARNLGIPLSNLDQAVDVALAGPERRIDVGVIEIDVSGEDQQPNRQVFMVMAGLGFDAEVMASVQPELKQRVGWFAYVVEGARRLRGRSTGIVMRLDDTEPIRRRVRSVVIGNCGELTGGLQLLPDARVDDGWLDVVVVAPRRVLGWGAVVLSVLSRPRLSRNRPRASARNPIMQHLRCRSLEIRAEKPLAVQLDGDPVGDARAVRARVDRLGLVVRTPR